MRRVAGGSWVVGLGARHPTTLDQENAKGTLQHAWQPRSGKYQCMSAISSCRFLSPCWKNVKHASKTVPYEVSQYCTGGGTLIQPRKCHFLKDVGRLHRCIV